MQDLSLCSTLSQSVKSDVTLLNQTVSDLKSDVSGLSTNIPSLQDDLKGLEQFQKGTISLREHLSMNSAEMSRS